MKSVDLSGKVFNRLTALYSISVNVGRKKSRWWVCKCSCGNETKVLTNRLTSGHTTSCGCRQKEARLENCVAHSIKPTHGCTNTKAYKTWASMRERVKPTWKAANRYYDRGITVCDRWESFENFLSDMGHPPPGLSIDRIDVNKGYSPDNCRWATVKTQQRNRELTRYLLIDGKKMPLMLIAEELGIKKSAAQYFFSTLKKIRQSYKFVDIEV